MDCPGPPLAEEAQLLLGDPLHSYGFNRTAREKLRMVLDRLVSNFFVEFASILIALWNVGWGAKLCYAPFPSTDTTIDSYLMLNYGLCLYLAFDILLVVITWHVDLFPSRPKDVVEILVHFGGLLLVYGYWRHLPIGVFRLLGLAVNSARLITKLRYLVGGNKLFKIDPQVSLDFSLISEGVAAMGIPASSGSERLWRNHHEDAAKYLCKHHKGSHMVVNLCAERVTPSGNFHAVLHNPTVDHDVTTLDRLLDALQAFGDFEMENPKNLIAVHCLGGKGRTGVMVCAWLLATRRVETAAEAITLFGERRTDPLLPGPRRSVANACQVRQLVCLEELVRRYNVKDVRRIWEAQLHKPRLVYLRKVVIHSLPACVTKGRIRLELRPEVSPPPHPVDAKAPVLRDTAVRGPTRFSFTSRDCGIVRSRAFQGGDDNVPEWTWLLAEDEAPVSNIHSDFSVVVWLEVENKPDTFLARAWLHSDYLDVSSLAYNPTALKSMENSKGQLLNISVPLEDDRGCPCGKAVASPSERVEQTSQKGNRTRVILKGKQNWDGPQREALNAEFVFATAEHLSGGTTCDEE